MIKLRILNVAESESDLLKIAPLMTAICESPEAEAILVHTGRRDDDSIVDSVMQGLDFVAPDIQLDIGATSQARQTAAMFESFEHTIGSTAPDVVVVVGSGNSTLAAGITSVKMGVPVAHVEAGLRSFDRAAPEEINGVIADAIADFLFVSEASAANNLLSEGIPTSKIHFCGNPLVDTLVALDEEIRCSRIASQLGLVPDGYAVFALEQDGSNRSRRDVEIFAEAIAKIQHFTPVVVAVNPGTLAALHESGLWRAFGELRNVHAVDRLALVDYLALVKSSSLTLTDDGNVQELTTALRVPCLTLGPTTQRPVTTSYGTNVLVPRDSARVVAEALQLVRGDRKVAGVPPMWDGKAAARILSELLKRREQMLELYRATRVREPLSCWPRARKLPESPEPVF